MVTVKTEDIVPALFEYAKPLDKRFSEITVDGKLVYLYPDPFRVTRSDLKTTNKKSLVTDGDVVYRLTAEEEFALLKMLSEKMRFPIRHPDLVEQFEAAYSEGGDEFKRNVQTLYSSRTGQLIVVNNEGYTRRILGIQTPDNEARQLIVPDRALPNGYRAINVPTPTKTGYFTKLPVPIPTDNDIIQNRPSKGRIGYWNGNYPDDKGVSAVWCKWLFGVGWLYAGAGMPLGRYDIVLSMATEAPLNK